MGGHGMRGSAHDGSLPIGLERRRRTDEAAEERVIEQARVILVVDESKSRRALACRLLSGLGYIAQEASTAAEASALIAEYPPDAVLVAWELPDAPAPEAVAEWMSREDSRCIPVLVLTPHAEPGRIREALNAGATDFVREPIEAIELDARLRAALRVHDLNRQLLRLARRDPLTGLCNRRALVDHFRREVDRARRHCHGLSMALIDADHFKAVNDRLGHEAGDEVLVALARMLEDVFRASDLIARWGGEEFVVLMPETDQAGARLGLERFCERLRQASPKTVLGRLAVRVSAGVVTADQSVGLIEPDDLLEAADRALQRAKDAGRDRVESATAADAPDRIHD